MKQHKEAHTPDNVERFEAEFQAWIEEMEASKEATRQSEILTAEDYGIIINV